MEKDSINTIQKAIGINSSYFFILTDLFKKLLEEENGVKNFGNIKN